MLQYHSTIPSYEMNNCDRHVLDDTIDIRKVEQWVDGLYSHKYVGLLALIVSLIERCLLKMLLYAADVSGAVSSAESMMKTLLILLTGYVIREGA
jgi:hypothetical protein